MRTIFHKTYLLACIAGLLLLSGCGDEKMALQGLPQVTFIELATTPTDLMTELTGRTTAFETAEIRPQVSGIIKSRLFTEGSQVKQGDVLYQIDPALFQAAVNSAKAGLLQAQASAFSANTLAKRYGTLVGNKAVSRQEYDNALAAAKQANAAVEVAKAALNTAEINLGYTQVTSPISGIIGKSSVTPGALVSAGQPTPLATVQQLSPIYVDVTQSSTDYLRLKNSVEQGKLSVNKIEGAPAALLLPDGTQHPEEGVLLFSEVTIDPSTGSYVIRAQFPNEANALMQNLFVRLRIATAKSDSAILIPQRTVTRDAKGTPQVKVLTPKVFEDPSQKPAMPAPNMDIYAIELRTISIAQSLGNQWIVIDGLKPGEKLLMDGAIKLMPGMNMVIGTPHTDTPATLGQPQKK